jgi:hypothetical protein
MEGFMRSMWHIYDLAYALLVAATYCTSTRMACITNLLTNLLI